MAGDVYPRHAPRSRQSDAEVAVWTALRRGLPAGWTAWHSLRLRWKNRWEGEGDFVIAAPDRGLLVLEVKGGRIELRDGRWYQNGSVLARGPRQQALGFMTHLMDALRERGADVPGCGVACVFPDAEFSADQGPGAGDLEGIVMGARHLAWIEQALPPLLHRAVRDVPPPRDRRWLEVLHELWGATWVPKLSLADEATDGEARVIALVDEQLALLETAEDNPRAIVSGGAGTGKTLLARELCQRAAARGRRVRYLCFTDALAQAVDRGFAAARAGGAELRAMPIRRFAGELLAASGAAVRTEDPTYWETASRAACEALPPVEARPELLVVDEAQDLDDGDWALVGALAGPGALWILGDDRQAFWRRSPIPDVIAQGAVRLKLKSQLRNPPAIAALAARYVAPQPDGRASEPVLEAVVAPGAVRVIEVAAGEELDRVAAEVSALLAAGARPQDLAIITLAGQSASQLLRRDALGGQLLVRADSADAGALVVADTFLRFKGLERPFVILVELAAGHASEYDRRMHIAITRATSRLVLIATAQDLAADARLAPPA